MALTKLGVPIGAEVVSFNHAKGVVNLDLDSGDEGYTTEHLLAGAPGTERQRRFEQLKVGDILRVLPIADCGTRGVVTRFRCSERLDHPVDMPEGFEGDEPEQPKAEPDKVLVAKFPAGMRIKGKVLNAGGSNIMVQLKDGLRGRLPIAELAGMKVTSVKSGVNISAKVKTVDGGGVVLTRAGL